MRYELFIFKIKLLSILKFIQNKVIFFKALLKEARFLHNLRLGSSLFQMDTLL